MPINLCNYDTAQKSVAACSKIPVPCTYSFHLMEPVSPSNTRCGANIQVNNTGIYLLFSFFIIFALLVTEIAVCSY